MKLEDAKELWDQLPGADDLDALGTVVCEIASGMDDRELPEPDVVVEPR